MKVDRDEVVRIASLASLEFDQEELEQTAEEMSRILDYIDQLESVDVSSVTSTDSANSVPLRPDLVGESLVIDDIDANAPSMLHGHFVVPKVIGGD